MLLPEVSKRLPQWFKSVAGLVEISGQGKPFEGMKKNLVPFAWKDGVRWWWNKSIAWASQSRTLELIGEYNWSA